MTTAILNRGKLTGMVVHKYHPRPNILILTLLVRRAGRLNYPDILILGEEAAAKANEEIQEQVRYSFDCHFQTTKKEVENGKFLYRQNVVCDSYALLQPEMNQVFGEGIASVRGKYPLDEDRFELKGTVTHVFAPPENANIAILTLFTQTDRGAFPKVSCFQRTAEYIHNGNIKEGDIVCVIGTVQTDKKMIDGKPRYYESIVCEDIAKC